MLRWVGINQLTFELVPMERWSEESWSLAITSGTTLALVQVASYVPYSGMTSAQA